MLVMDNVLPPPQALLQQQEQEQEQPQPQQQEQEQQQQAGDSRLLNTPLMNSIIEEDLPSVGNEFYTPSLGDSKDVNDYNDFAPPPPSSVSSTQTRPFFASPSLSRPNSSALYSAKDGNNSSSSLIYNPTFTFGEAKSNASSESRKQSLKYVPGPQLAPPTSRTRSPVRSSSPESRDTRRVKNSNLESPFNFGASLSQNNPPSSASRASFRKGHRYKHSSVSMNFFQEPEVKIPLNIARSLPIPDFNDLIRNLAWPKAHTQLVITFLQFVTCIIIFQLGHTKSWNNFITLSHFITYDIIGSLIIILVENLSQFEVWSTGTITFPFGLNRIDVATSFASAVSLCFVGLDLIFHMIEEFIVLFVESTESSENHEEIVSQIPHSHHLENGLDLSSGNATIWYFSLTINFLLSSLSLIKTFYANKNSNLKTKNPIITIFYTFYLFAYPSLFNYLHVVSDYIAATLIAIFILIHGVTIAEWTSTILLLGFSTTFIPVSSLLGNPTEQEVGDIDISSRPRSVSTLPLVSINTSTKGKNQSKSPSSKFSRLRTIRKTFSSQEPTILKSKIKEEIEGLTEFVSKCSLNYDDLIIAKVNFNLYIILMKLTLKGGSNDDELNLRLAINKCIKKVLPCSETTIEVDRI